MGAVQLTAPNTSKAGHCTDEVDVMCYRDTSTTVTRQVCNRAGQVDCNNNDYFHPNPGPSNYLANKWNVADSRFLESTAAPTPPPKTTITVPSTAMAGAPVAVRADVATAGAGIVWTSTRSDCWFDDPRAASTSWACPATATGAGEITVHVTENGISTPYTTPIALTVPATKLVSSVDLRASETAITVGRSVRLSTRVVAMATGATVPGLGVEFQARPKGSKVWTSIGSDATNKAGVAYLEVAPQRNVSYRSRTVWNPTWDTQFSGALDVSVATKLTTKVNQNQVAGYSTTPVSSYATTKLSGTVSPDKAGKVIKLRRKVNGRWRTIREKRISANSTYSFRYTPRVGGEHRFRIVKPADTRNKFSRKVLILRVGR
jgi:hypothetical protein